MIAAPAKNERERSGRARAAACLSVTIPVREFPDSDAQPAAYPRNAFGRDESAMIDDARVRSEHLERTAVVGGDGRDESAMIDDARDPIPIRLWSPSRLLRETDAHRVADRAVDDFV